ncbi:DUF2946 family protein [Telmatospirillum sp.]|uniref:DUF2946 family protein n=1 Tax=Telmatospirillum sp. TaxID=2079197 RepID=UPI00284EA2D1|nr:DUF2946 family protein [Telmatospirillum sp.]MDR3440485.1 hypothetical protein [Telmatospirillum sp.]
MKKVRQERRSGQALRSSAGSMRRFVSAWLGCLLLAANLLVAGLLPARPAQPLFAQALTASGQHVEFCTTHGLMIVDSSGQPVSPSRDGSDFCVFCLPLMHGTTALPVAPQILGDSNRLILVVAALATVQPVVEDRPFSPSFPRAPPSV